mmetsp:Transcript_30409/g.71759  ORF Transcript_30409/g.71759 Transcript_30409/m.71759 type:complete len:235 (+) Transcript_30409:665-1369(+)
MDALQKAPLEWWLLLLVFAFAFGFRFHLRRRGALRQMDTDVIAPECSPSKVRMQSAERASQTRSVPSRVPVRTVQGSTTSSAVTALVCSKTRRQDPVDTLQRRAVESLDALTNTRPGERQSNASTERVWPRQFRNAIASLLLLLVLLLLLLLLLLSSLRVCQTRTIPSPDAVAKPKPPPSSREHTALMIEGSDRGPRTVVAMLLRRGGGGTELGSQTKSTEPVPRLQTRVLPLL